MSDTVTCCAPVHSSVLRSSPCSQEPPDHQELARHHHDTDRHQEHLNITRPRQRMLFTGTVGERGKLVEYHLTVLGMVGAEMIRQARGHLLLNTGWSRVNIIWKWILNISIKYFFHPNPSDWILCQYRKAKNAVPHDVYSCFPNPAQPSFRDISRTVTQ